MPKDMSPGGADKKADEGDKAAASDDDKKDKKADSKKAEKAEPDADAMPKKTLKDVLTTSGALFVFSFAKSDVHQAAEEKCGKQSKDDPKKKADCMSKASEKLDGDAYQFTEAGENKGVWATVRRKGDKLNTVKKVDIEFGKETDKSITITPAKGKEVVIQIPSEGEIVFDDPKQGKMVYELKLGLVGDQAR